jgi:hypothetical protein
MGQTHKPKMKQKSRKSILKSIKRIIENNKVLKTLSSKL